MKKLYFFILIAFNLSAWAQSKASRTLIVYPKDSVFYNASAPNSAIGLAVTTDSPTKWIEYSNTIINQPLTNYVFLKGSKEIGLYMTVPKDSISYYRYNVLENDKEFLVTNGKLDASSAQNVFTRAQVNLGRFNIDNKKLTIEYYNLKSRDKVATTTIYNKVINPPELFLTTLEVINRKKVRGVEMKNRSDGFTFRVHDSLTVNSILLAIKPTDLTFIYHVYLENLSSGKSVHIGNSWNYGYIVGYPHLLIDALYFIEPGDYQISIIPELSNSFHVKKSFATKATKIRFTVLKSESSYSQSEVLIWTSIIILAAITLSGLIFFFQKRSHARKIKGEEDQRTYAQMQLNAIRSQLNPHFMFNALSGIQNLMNRNETDQANRYLSKFARLTRRVLINSDLISMADEITLLDDYLQMERLRFSFEYEIIIDSELNPSNLEFPAMLLQPLVENAVKHGVADLGQNGRIVIEVTKQGKNVIIFINDNGTGFDIDQTAKGLGLKLTKSRIALLNGIYRDSPITLNMNIETSNTIITITLNQWL
jgi:two-component system LytT family sensor kinase